MKSTICTLFEGSYHHGVAALTNSLYLNGFRGIIYAGYRGALPEWAKKTTQCVLGKWNSVSILDVAEDLQLIFIPLDTNYHLTNYKPDFMLELLDGPAKYSDAIFYFDPDICVTENWGFFEEWVKCGVALCEDINSPLPENHPRRVGWRQYFSKYHFDLKYIAPEYANGGFIGVAREHYSFIKLWLDLQVGMADAIGTLAASKLTKGAAYKTKGFANCFDASDQDALNAATEVTECKLSIIGKEAMAFKSGGALLPHALGRGKPWERAYLMHAFSGIPPRLIDKIFWSNSRSPISSWSLIWRISKRLDLLAASIVSRVIRRN